MYWEDNLFVISCGKKPRIDLVFIQADVYKACSITVLLIFYSRVSL